EICYSQSCNRYGKSFTCADPYGLGYIIGNIVFYDMSFCQRLCKVCICIPLQVIALNLKVCKGLPCIECLAAVSCWSNYLNSQTRITTRTTGISRELCHKEVCFAHSR